MSDKFEKNPYDSGEDSKEEKDHMEGEEEDGEGDVVVKEYTIDEVIHKVVDELWEKNNRPKEEELTKEETAEFVKGTLKEMGEDEDEKFVQKDFDDAYYKFDTDGNGSISKKEMFEFIQRVAGYDLES